MQRRVMLVILDGWGLAPAGPANAISMADTPVFNHIWSTRPHMRLDASGEAVGLPKGQMGNSEVGHLNIGAGRVVLQDLPRITKSIADGEFFHNQALLDTFKYLKKSGKSLHLMGLVSPGGVHSHQKHLYALLEMAKIHKVHQVYIHVITDGRDVEPNSALKYVEALEKEIKSVGVGTIATVMGRYYAMDRDNRWGRIEAAYEAIVDGKGELADSAIDAVKNSYALGVADEFIKPAVVDPRGTIRSEDALVFFNFRSDRPREICHALLDSEFKSFVPRNQVKNLYMVTMAEYDPKLKVKAVIFPPAVVEGTLAEEISAENLTQFHIAETEKYAHVTFFFNGGVEQPVQGEDRLMIPSPQVATYDLKPQMSIGTVKKELLGHIGSYDFIVVNFANPDMVGHTGKIPAAVEACKDVDAALGEVLEAGQKAGYDVLVTADHGNIEKMINDDGTPDTMHTTNQVPLILVSEKSYRFNEVVEPKLADIAPTILELMGLHKTKEMTGRVLVKE